jgi:transcriptional regulator with XRE-family HTH domain
MITAAQSRAARGLLGWSQQALADRARVGSSRDEVRWLMAQDLWMSGKRSVKPPTPKFIDPVDAMPVTEPERTAEAVRRLFPELKIYEQRAAARRDRAIREISRHTMRLSQLNPKC